MPSSQTLIDRLARGAARTERTGHESTTLIDEVVHSLQFAERILAMLRPNDFVHGQYRDAPKRGVIGEKVVAEIAMLLHFVAPVAHRDERIAGYLHALAMSLVPLARQASVMSAICLDPGYALDHSVAHVILSALGHGDTAMDELLASSLAISDPCGGGSPERLAHRRLEQHWLLRVWGRPASRQIESRTLADSMLAGRVDALTSNRLDLYALTHSVMYASDIGHRRLRLARSRTEIQADALAGLAYALPAADYDLAGELLMTWPLLGGDFSPSAEFAWMVLTRVVGEFGVLPGIQYERGRRETLPPDVADEYVLTTCYHAVFVMGMLCAIMLRQDRLRPGGVPRAGGSKGAAAELLTLLDAEVAAVVESFWRRALRTMSPRSQDAVAPLILAILLRHATAKGDLKLVHAALHAAVRHDLAGGAAPAQAAALLRRGRILDDCLSAHDVGAQRTPASER